MNISLKKETYTVGSDAELHLVDELRNMLENKLGDRTIHSESYKMQRSLTQATNEL